MKDGLARLIYWGIMQWHDEVTLVLRPAGHKHTCRAKQFTSDSSPPFIVLKKKVGLTKVIYRGIIQWYDEVTLVLRPAGHKHTQRAKQFTGDGSPPSIVL